VILFQISLSGRHLQVLVAIRESTTNNRLFDRIDHSRFVSTVKTLLAEGLIAHHPRVDWRQGDKKISYTITKKGELVLQLAAMDLGDFLNEVKARRVERGRQLKQLDDSERTKNIEQREERRDMRRGAGAKGRR